MSSRCQCSWVSRPSLQLPRARGVAGFQSHQTRYTSPRFVNRQQNLSRGIDSGCGVFFRLPIMRSRLFRAKTPIGPQRTCGRFRVPTTYFKRIHCSAAATVRFWQMNEAAHHVREESLCERLEQDISRSLFVPDNLSQRLVMATGCRRQMLHFHV